LQDYWQSDAVRNTTPSARPMIVANMATYPKRRAPQVDQLNIVLNEYDAPIAELAEIENISQIIPSGDTKDTGKFYPDTKGAELVVLADDDIVLADDYVATTIGAARRLGPDFVYSHHGCVYLRPWEQKRWQKMSSLRRKLIRQFNPTSGIERHRKVYDFRKQIDEPIIVDQVGTGCAVLHQENMPSFAEMKSAQRFVDVEETIYTDFTKRPPANVVAEIKSFAFKVADTGTAPSGPEMRH